MWRSQSAALGKIDMEKRKKIKIICSFWCRTMNDQSKTCSIQFFFVFLVACQIWVHHEKRIRNIYSWETLFCLIIQSPRKTYGDARLFGKKSHFLKVWKKMLPCQSVPEFLEVWSFLKCARYDTSFENMGKTFSMNTKCEIQLQLLALCPHQEANLCFGGGNKISWLFRRRNGCAYLFSRLWKRTNWISVAAACRKVYG